MSPNLKPAAPLAHACEYTASGTKPGCGSRGRTRPPAAANLRYEIIDFATAKIMLHQKMLVSVQSHRCKAICTQCPGAAARPQPVLSSCAASKPPPAKPIAFPRRKLKSYLSRYFSEKSTMAWYIGECQPANRAGRACRSREGRRVPDPSHLHHKYPPRTGGKGAAQPIAGRCDAERLPSASAAVSR